MLNHTSEKPAGKTFWGHLRRAWRWDDAGCYWNHGALSSAAGRRIAVAGFSSVFRGFGQRFAVSAMVRTRLAALLANVDRRNSTSRRSAATTNRRKPGEFRIQGTRCASSLQTPTRDVRMPSFAGSTHRTLSLLAMYLGNGTATLLVVSTRHNMDLLSRGLSMYNQFSYYSLVPVWTPVYSRGAIPDIIGETGSGHPTHIATLKRSSPPQSGKTDQPDLPH
jgi:hypothetical protein